MFPHERWRTAWSPERWLSLSRNPPPPPHSWLITPCVCLCWILTLSGNASLSLCTSETTDAERGSREGAGLPAWAGLWLAHSRHSGGERSLNGDVVRPVFSRILWLNWKDFQLFMAVWAELFVVFPVLLLKAQIWCWWSFSSWSQLLNLLKLDYFISFNDSASADQFTHFFLLIHLLKSCWCLCQDSVKDKFVNQSPTSQIKVPVRTFWVIVKTAKRQNRS